MSRCDGFSKGVDLAAGRQGSRPRTSSRDFVSKVSCFVAGGDFPLPFLGGCCYSRNEHKFIISVSCRFQFGSVYPGYLFCKKKHCLDRPAVTIVCFGQQYLDECLALAHALGFSPLFDFHGLTENLDQHGRQIALVFTTTARIAGLTLAKLTFDRGMFVSDLAICCT